MNRIEANIKLLEILKETLCKNPNLRFIQALWALKLLDTEEVYDKDKDIYQRQIVDRFYEEPSKTLERIGYEESN